MRTTDSIETLLEALGMSLRERPTVIEQIMREVRLVDAATKTVNATSTVARASRRLHRGLWLAATVAGLGVAVILGLFFDPKPSVGWEEMSKAMRGKHWIHARNGRGGELWVSPELKRWAHKVNNNWIIFGDEKLRTRQEFKRLTEDRPGVITLTHLGEESVERMLPLDDLAANAAAVQPWIFGTTRIIDQKRRVVTEKGNAWIEFDLTLSPSVGPDYRGTLRIDPKTSLPARLREMSESHADDMRKWELQWEFAYPDRGPSEIYDLGVPRGAAVKDRMPSNTAQRVLDAMAASRARIGDFRMITWPSPRGPFDGLFGMLTSMPQVVWRKGERWRVDRCVQEQGAAGEFKPAAGQSQDDWLDERMRHTQPILICDGRIVNVNDSSENPLVVNWRPGKWAPQDLLAGNRSSCCLGQIYFAAKVYPDLTAPPGWNLEFDPQPGDADGCVLIRLSAESTVGGTGNEWYYIDPAKGHAVVRKELFNWSAAAKPDQLPANRQTIRMEDFRQSPTGCWYPTVIRYVNVVGNVDVATHYRFDFDADLPDSLFFVERSE
jgi:hypothetical protein